MARDKGLKHFGEDTQGTDTRVFSPTLSPYVLT